jgi:hypothetical protein
MKAAPRGRRSRDYRSALALGLVVLAALAGPHVAAADAAQRGAERVRVTVAFVPEGTSTAQLAAVEGVALGLLSAGLGLDFTPDGTYLDIGQGNRVFDQLYDEPLPPLTVRGGRVPPPEWDAVLRRARSAPAEIVPGLLASTLERAGMGARVAAGVGGAALVAANRDGRVRSAARCPQRGCAGLTVRSLPAEGLPALVGRQRGGDLLIAIERPPPEREGEQLSIGIAGGGFAPGGELTSDGTRLDGLVLSTDVAPTVLERFGVEVPGAVSGSPIRAEGEADPAELAALEERMRVIGPRRATVIGASLLAWIALTGLAAALGGRRAARIALPLAALAVVYVPAVLLATAAIEPGELAEALIVGIGCPLLAAATLALTRTYAAFAFACAVTVLAYAIDVIVGSPLTALSLIGSNPGRGVRFFGIGNELEATVAALIPLGVGAGLTAAGVESRRAAAGAFMVAALAGVLVFAPGRFGADVGAAIVLPIGAAVAAWSVLGGGRRWLLVALAAVPLAFAALIGIDLALGGDAHLSRSVLEAGGLNELGEVVERRVRLSADSFSDNALKPSFLACLALIATGVALRHRIADWLEGRPAALAGLLGAIVATVAGTLANDSGALLLIIGTAYASLFVAFAWSRSN